MSNHIVITHVHMQKNVRTTCLLTLVRTKGARRLRLRKSTIVQIT